MRAGSSNRVEISLELAVPKLKRNRQLNQRISAFKIRCPAIADFSKPERQIRWTGVNEKKIDCSLFLLLAFTARFEPQSPDDDCVVKFIPEQTPAKPMPGSRCRPGARRS